MRAAFFIGFCVGVAGASIGRLRPPRSTGVPPGGVWVAGGITPDNVSQLLAAFEPVGVDVSSGVEEAGRKSPAKIQAMMEAVRSHAG